jgi:hypothetical protein
LKNRILVLATKPQPTFLSLIRYAAHTMHYTIAILLMFAIESVCAADKVSAPDFSKYPQTGSFVVCTGGHMNAAWHLHQRTMLAITTDPAGGRCAVQYFVTETGRESDHPNVYDFARIQASRTIGDCQFSRRHKLGHPHLR